MLSVARRRLRDRLLRRVLDWLRLDAERAAGWSTLLGRVIGFGANMVLFFALFKLLARPHAPEPVAVVGALLGAVGFEVLKRSSFLLLAPPRAARPSRCSGSR